MDTFFARLFTLCSIYGSFVCLLACFIMLYRAAHFQMETTGVWPCWICLVNIHACAWVVDNLHQRSPRSLARFKGALGGAFASCPRGQLGGHFIVQRHRARIPYNGKYSWPLRTIEANAFIVCAYQANRNRRRRVVFVEYKQMYVIEEKK